MPIPEILGFTRQHGQVVPYFHDSLGRRIGTSVSAATRGSWTKVEQVAWLANYIIELQQDQLDKAIGSNGSPMPPLQGSSFALFNIAGGKKQFADRMYRGYQGQKVKLGLNPFRDLYGPGKDGHLRDDLRISYVDESHARISISRNSSRVKALANEKRAPWFGLHGESVVKLTRAVAGAFDVSFADLMVQVGVMAAADSLALAAKRVQQTGRRFLAMARRAA